MRKKRRFNKLAIILAVMLAFSGVGTAMAEPVGSTAIEEIVSMEDDSAEIVEEEAAGEVSEIVEEEAAAEASEAAEEDTVETAEEDAAEAVEEDAAEVTETEAAEVTGTEAAEVTEAETAEVTEAETAEVTEAETEEVTETDAAEVKENDAAEAVEEETTEAVEEETTVAVKEETTEAAEEETTEAAEQVEIIEDGVVTAIQNTKLESSLTLTAERRVDEDGDVWVFLDWNNLEGIDHFVVYRDGNQILSYNCNSLWDPGYGFSDGMEYGNTYTFRVAAFNSSGKQFAISNTVTYTHEKSVAMTLTAYKNTNGNVCLQWNRPTDAVYFILRKNGKYLVRLENNEDLFYHGKGYYIDKAAKNGETHVYSVEAYDNNDQQIGEAAYLTYLLCSVTITAVGNTTKGVVVYWKATPGIDHYDIYVKYRDTSDNPGSWDTESVKAASGIQGTSTNFTIPISAGFSSGSLYDITIYAYDEDDNYLCDDLYVKRYIGTTTMNAPTCIRDGIRVTWPRVYGAEKYVIFRHIGTGAVKWKYLTTVDATDDAVQVFDNIPPSGQSFTPGGWYAYTVRAIGAANPMQSDDTCYGGQPAGRSVRFREPVKISKVQSVSGGVKATFTSVAAGYTYGLYRAPVTAGTIGSYSLVATTVSSSVGKDVSVIDTTAVNGKGYRYCVRCLSKDKKVPLSSYKNTMTITYNKP